MKTLDSKKIMAFFIGLVVWFFGVIPYFAGLSAERGIIVSFSIFLFLSYLYFRIVFKQVGINPKHVLLFVWSYMIVDILQPPKLISLNTPPILLSAEQSFSSDVFFYEIFKSVGLPHNTAWYLVYFGVPILAFALLMRYYTGRKMNRIVMGSLAK